MSMAKTGKVFLVGAGPGDPELITVRGLRCLQQADVVIYDRLVSEALLAEAPPEAELIFAGKETGYHAMRQEAINAVMVERARAGQVVVRLKGGDPFVFGRGGEEMAHCIAAGIPCEVVPGVTSAIGVPGRAGIPMTQRGIARTFAVVTAHRASGQGDDTNWDALAAMDTLVVLMGVRRLPDVTASLIRGGRSADTPAALIERGTLPSERIVTGVLGDIAALAAQAGIRPPATLIVGEVVWGATTPMPRPDFFFQTISKSVANTDCAGR